MNKLATITADKYDTLVKRLDYCKNVLRLEIAEKIQTAIKEGDLGEISSYSDAKKAHIILEREIMELEYCINQFEAMKKAE